MHVYTWYTHVYTHPKKKKWREKYLYIFNKCNIFSKYFWSEVNHTVSSNIETPFPPSNIVTGCQFCITNWVIRERHLRDKHRDVAPVPYLKQRAPTINPRNRIPFSNEKWYMDTHHNPDNHNVCWAKEDRSKNVFDPIYFLKCSEYVNLSNDRSNDWLLGLDVRAVTKQSVHWGTFKGSANKLSSGNKQLHHYSLMW